MSNEVNPNWVSKPFEVTGAVDTLHSLGKIIKGCIVQYNNIDISIRCMSLTGGRHGYIYIIKEINEERKNIMIGLPGDPDLPPGCTNEDINDSLTATCRRCESRERSDNMVEGLCLSCDEDLITCSYCEGRFELKDIVEDTHGDLICEECMEIDYEKE